MKALLLALPLFFLPRKWRRAYFGWLALLLLLAPLAKANSLLTFTITGGATASGSFLVGDPYTCNFFKWGYAPIIGMTGTFDGAPVTLLDPGPQTCDPNAFYGPYGYASVEWPGTCCFLVNEAPPVFTANGSTWAILFQDLGAVNNDPGWLFVIDNLSNGGHPINPAYMSIADPPAIATPEPGVLELLDIGGMAMVGLLLLYLWAERRSKSNRGSFYE